MNESFCELIKCRFYQDKNYECKLTPHFKCRNDMGEFTCIYLTKEGKVKDLNTLIERDPEYRKEVDYRSPLVIISALIKCGYLHESRAGNE